MPQSPVGVTSPYWTRSRAHAPLAAALCPAYAPRSHPITLSARRLPCGERRRGLSRWTSKVVAAAKMSVVDRYSQWSARRGPWALFPLATMSPLAALALCELPPINLVLGRQSCVPRLSLQSR